MRMESGKVLFYAENGILRGNVKDLSSGRSFRKNGDLYDKCF